MINTFINAYNSLSYPTKLNNGAMNVQSTKPEVLTYTNGSTTVNFTINSHNRISIQNTSDKYIEQVKWGTGNNMAIAIGLNPSARLPSTLDNTNKLVSIVLHRNGYDGYYLINLFSCIQSSNFKRKGHYDQTLAISNAINSYLSSNHGINLNVVFFCGRSCCFTKTMMNNLNSISSTRVNYHLIGTTNNRHQHPGRGVSTTTITLSPPLNTIPFNGNKIK